MFKKILVPVDGSRTSGLGIDMAAKLAREQGAELCLLHVIDGRIVTQGMEMDTLGAGRVLGALRAGGKKILDAAEARARRSRVQPLTMLDDRSIRSVADAVVRHARKWRADLIVLGTHGRRGMARLVMGSDAEDIVRASPTPVLLVRSGARGGGARR